MQELHINSNIARADLADTIVLLEDFCPAYEMAAGGDVAYHHDTSLFALMRPARNDDAIALRERRAYPAKHVFVPVSGHQERIVDGFVVDVVSAY